MDLSYPAAKNLGIVGPGTAHVRNCGLGYARPPLTAAADLCAGHYYSGNFTSQVGAFANRENAKD